MTIAAQPSTERWRGALRAVAACAALAVVYSLGAMLPFWFLQSPESVTPFFPPAGITLCVLTLTGKRTWPRWIAVIAACEYVIDVSHGQSVAMALGFVLANTLEPIVGATTLRKHYFRQRPNLRRQLVAFIACGMVAGPVVGAVIGATTAYVFGDASPWLTVAGRWWLGDALGVLVLATPILAYHLRSRKDRTTSPLETALIVAIGAGVMIVPAVRWHHPMTYAVLPVLIWAAIRGGTRAVSLAGVGVAFAANWAAVTGRAGDLIVGQEHEQLVLLQVYLAITLLTGLALGIEVEERRRLEAAGRRSEAERRAAELHAAEVEQTERARLAHETHDIVGHGLNVMLLQAGAARRLLATDPAQARVLLESLEDVGRRACRDLDVVLASERTNRMVEERGLAAVPGLVALLREAGLEVDLTMLVPNHTLPTLVDRTAYRVLREALTNVAKHAPTAATRVTVQLGTSDLHLEVVDDGGGVKAKLNGHNGMGIAGMRAWVTTLCGDLVATPLPQGGFAVMATIPTSAGER